jgi:hypothetical protein
MFSSFFFSFPFTYTTDRFYRIFNRYRGCKIQMEIIKKNDSLPKHFILN